MNHFSNRRFYVLALHPSQRLALTCTRPRYFVGLKGAAHAIGKILDLRVCRPSIGSYVLVDEDVWTKRDKWLPQWTELIPSASSS